MLVPDPTIDCLASQIGVAGQWLIIYLAIITAVIVSAAANVPFAAAICRKWNKHNPQPTAVDIIYDRWQSARFDLLVCSCMH